MSLVFITHHNENISTIDLDKPEVINYKSNYVSKFRKAVHDEHVRRAITPLPKGKLLLTSSKKHSHLTMGAAEEVSNPADFLRKDCGIRFKRVKEHQCPPRRELPPVPRLGVKPKAPVTPAKKPPLMGKPHTSGLNSSRKPIKHRANFVAVNIKKMTKCPAAKKSPRYVDTVQGDTHPMLKSGLLPLHMNKKDYGKVPVYLKRTKKILKRVQRDCFPELIDPAERCKDYEVVGVRPLEDAERKEVLEGLRKNRFHLMEEYQGMSLFTDTVSKKQIKLGLEKRLNQIETDIALLETDHIIYISTE